MTDPGDTTRSTLPQDILREVELLALEHGFEPEMFLNVLVESALGALQHGSLRLPDMTDSCESPRLVRDQLTEQRFGFRVSGDRHEVADAEAVLRDELGREGLPTELGDTREYAVGRGYGITTLLLVAGAVVVFFKGVKAIDEGLPILKKWIRAIRRAAARLDASGYTASFVKTMCLERALEAGTSPAEVDTNRITATIQHVDIGMEADVMTGHWTVTIPTKKGTALVYIVDQNGEVRSSAQLAYPSPDDVEALLPAQDEGEDAP